MTDFPVHARFDGPIVMVGFGSIGRGTLPLLERHIKFDRSKFVVIDPVDTALQGAITALGMQPIVCDTVMADAEDERRLATDIARIVEGWVADGPS